MAPLYAVKLEVDLVVVAGSPSEAELEADQYARDALTDGNGSLGFAHEVKTAADLPHPDWLDSRPYGVDDDRTIRQLLEAPSEPELVRDTWTMEMFPKENADG